MRLVIAHPTDDALVAACGLNHTRIGWWAEVRRAGRRVEEYDGLTAPRGESTLQGVIDVLVRHRFLSEDDLSEALRLLPAVDCIEDIEDADVRRAAAVVARLKRAAAD